MASVLPSLGAVGAAGAFYAAYAKTRAAAKRRERLEQAKGPKARGHDNSARYPPSHSGQPASSLSDTITYSQVGSKNVTFVKTYIGIRGTRVWQYYLPESNTTINSYKPLGFHLAR